LPTTQEAGRYDPRDWVTPEDLNVDPALLGAPLARPAKRLGAMAIDLLIVALLSNVGNVWLVMGAGLLVLMHVRKPLALDSRHRKWMVWALAAGLLSVGAWQAAMSPSVERKHGHRHDAEDAEATEAIPGLSAEKNAEVRIALLQAELAEARKPKSFNLNDQIHEWMDDVGLGLSWAIAYFSLLPVWWRGQTLGKRVFGLRVVELTGKPLTVMRAFKRYGGYAAGMATGLFGFAQVFWDPNRQAIQDKTAHTVVIDLRRKLLPAPKPEPLPTSEEPS
jgi:uncharacterized RDD family membrane protein YckC